MTSDEVYPNAPLAAVIVEVRHPVAAPLAGASLAAMRLALASVTPIQRNEHAIELGPAGATPTQLIRFISRDAHQSVSFRANGIVVESTAYPGWVRFQELVHLAVTTRHELAPLDGLERVGLRYIDEIRPPHAESAQWQDWVSEELLGPRGLGRTLGQQITAHQGVAQFGGTPGVAHTLRWGTGTGQAFVSTENLRRPAEPSGPFFLIDTDGGWLPPDGSVPELDPIAVMRILDDLHGPIRTIFETTITDRLRDEVLRAQA